MAGARARDALRRSVGALTVTALLGAAVAVGAGLTWPGSAAPSARTPASAIPPLAPSQSTLSAASCRRPARSCRHRGRRRRRWRARARPSARPASPSPPVPSPMGSFLVSEVITLPAPATEAVLRPPSIGNAGTRFKQLRPTATQIEVSAGGQPLAVPDGPVHSQVNASLGLTHPAATTALPPDAGQRGQPTRQGRPHRGRSQLTARPDACRAAGQGGRDRPDRGAVAHLSPASAGEELRCGAGAAPKFWTLRPIPFRPVASAGAVRPAGGAMRS